MQEPVQRWLNVRDEADPPTARVAIGDPWYSDLPPTRIASLIVCLPA